MTGPVIAGAPGPGALALGRWTAERLGVPLIVAVVHPAPAALGSGRVDAEWVADRHRAARQVLDEARAELAGTGTTVEYRMVASSSAAHGLHDLAEETDAAQIVVGSGQEALGSTAERLLSGSSCPVAVVPGDLVEPPGGLGLIGVAYVDTPDGRAALAEAAKLAAGARLRLYTVVAEGRTPLPFLHDAERVLLETARETYEKSLTVAAAGVPGVSTDWRIITGDVVEVLAGLDEVDVLFCGSRGYGPARRVLLGGVSTRLLRKARRPVVVVPRSS